MKIKIISFISLYFASNFSLITDCYAIDRGIRAKDNQFPYTVKIGIYRPSFFFFESIQSYCTGTLIGASTVLTSAHCVNQDSNSIIRISKQGAIKADTSDGIIASKIYVSAKYNKLKSESTRFPDENSLKRALIPHEISFITLSKPVKNIPTGFVKLNCKREINFNSQKILVGYGSNIDHNFDNKNLSQFLLYGANFISKTNSTYSDYVLLYDENNPSLQLGNLGDSGSALFDQVNNRQVVLGTLSSVGDFATSNDGNVLAALNHFSPTSSLESIAYYKELVKDKYTSNELKSILESCIKESLIQN